MDERIWAGIVVFLFSTVVTLVIKSINKGKKYKDDLFRKDIESIFEKTKQISINQQQLSESFTEISNSMIKGFGEIKLYISENYVNNIQLREMDVRNVDEHKEIFRRINDKTA